MKMGIVRIAGYLRRLWRDSLLRSDSIAAFTVFGEVIRSRKTRKTVIRRLNDEREVKLGK